MKLHRSGSNELVDRQVTASGGNYKFEDVEPGDYYVVFVLPNDESYSFTTRQAGTDKTIDSDGQVSDVFTLVAGQNLTDIDAGLIGGPDFALPRVKS